MSVLYIRAEDGRFVQIKTIRGPKGEQGEAGPAGPQGEKGDDGASFKVLGLYPSVDALTAAHPAGNAGDAYAVGTAEDNRIYLWDVDRGEWSDVGALAGPQGPKGVTFTPSVAADGTLSWKNDGSLVNPQAVNIRGPKGEQGPQGEPGPEGPAGADGESFVYTLSQEDLVDGESPLAAGTFWFVY